MASIMPLLNRSGSKRRLVLSALLICAIILELGKRPPPHLLSAHIFPRNTKEGIFTLLSSNQSDSTQ